MPIPSAEGHISPPYFPVFSGLFPTVRWFVKSRQPLRLVISGAALVARSRVPLFLSKSRRSNFPDVGQSATGCGGGAELSGVVARQKSPVKAKAPAVKPGPSCCGFGSGGWTRTNDLRVMSPTSCHCSTPRCCERMRVSEIACVPALRCKGLKLIAWVKPLDWLVPVC